MARKNIGLFLSGDDAQLHGDFVVGVKTAALQNDCNLICFYNLFNKAPFGVDETLAPSIIYGESSILRGHDFSQLDGVIIFGDTFFSKDMKEAIVEKAMEYNIPIIDVDDTDDRFPCINYADEIGMDIIMKHVLEEHHCEKIYFVSGFKGNRQSMEREDSYRRALEAHNIPFKEEYICYGSFYSPYAKEAIKPLIEQYGMPDAIVCANDSMAIGIIGYLNSFGYVVPEDCIVTGFDGIREAQTYIPSITSVKRSIAGSGEKAVECLCEIFNGSTVKKEIFMDPVLLLSNSCGCVPIDSHPFDNFYNLMVNRTNHRDYFNCIFSIVTRDFESCNSVFEIINASCRAADFFNNESINFYLCEDVIHTNEMAIFQTKRDKKNKKKQSIYTTKMICIPWTKANGVGDAYTIKSADFIKDYFDNSAKASYLGISPLYYQERIIGFVSLDHTLCTESIQMLYTWLVNISAAIGNYCLRTEMSMLISKLDNMYVKDNLTNLYNRFGLYRHAEILKDSLQLRSDKVFGIIVDADGLKGINDNYGHDAGDNAILQVANAIRFASKNQEVLSRIGGDEYFVFGSCQQESDVQIFIKRIYEYISEYNSIHDNPYNIDCSCGYYVAESKKESLETIMRIADARMYENKQAKKKK